MTTTDLLKRTPVRLAGAFMLLFTLTVLAVFAGLYSLISTDLSQRIHHRVLETRDALAAVEREGGLAELARVVTGEAESVRDPDTIFLVVDSRGAFQAGNVRDIDGFEGWRPIKRATLPYIANPADPDEHFLATWTDLRDGSLLIGGSDANLRHTERILVRGLYVSLAATALIVLTSGLWLAQRAQRRIGAFAATLAAVSRGRIAERVPLRGSGDDLDHVAGQMNETLAHLQTLITNVNRSSSDIAHDLKKPIGRARHRLDQAQRQAKTPAEFNDAVDAAILDLDQIVETFESILRITQIETGAQRARFANVDLRELLSDVIEVYAPVAEDAGHSLERLDEQWPTVKIAGDRQLLVQLAANLFENAIRHCPRGAVIRAGLSKRDAVAIITVVDTGPGIPVEERENVFHRHYRLERERSTAGCGLGLALVAAVAELHGARVALSDAAPGLRVDVTFQHPRI